MKALAERAKVLRMRIEGERFAISTLREGVATLQTPYAALLDHAKALLDFAETQFLSVQSVAHSVDYAEELRSIVASIRTFVESFVRDCGPCVSNE